jgi:DMSO/TMAO reductase YedYZ heme-binding membrane subunit
MGDALDRRPWLISLTAGIAALATVALALRIGHDAVEQWRLAARWTARVGFPVFLLTYVASSLYRLWPHPGSRTLLRRRRWWGLGFAASHTVHLAALVTFFRASGEAPETATLVGGGFAYLLLFAMAATSNRAAMAWLGRGWKRLHTVGIHTLWTVYAFSYSGRLFDPERETIGAVFAPLAFAALGLRLWARYRPAQPRAA